MCWDPPWERWDHRQSAGGIPSFFSLDVGKILILLGLQRGDRPSSGQNIGTKGLRGKILRNKELDEERVPSPLIANWLGLGRTMLLCAFYLLGQGCSSHVCSFSLCISVEKLKNVAVRVRAFWSVVPVNCAQSCIPLCSTLLVSVLPSSHSYPRVIADLNSTGTELWLVKTRK